MTTQRTRIQAFLVGLANSGKFLRVAYNPETRLPLDIDSDSQSVSPTAAYSNETGAVYSEDVLQKRRVVRQREAWRFELRIDFQYEVTAELFEDSLLDPVPVLPADDGFPCVFLHLVESTAEHPVQQQPTVGSKFVYFFEAVEGRR